MIVALVLFVVSSVYGQDVLKTKVIYQEDFENNFQERAGESWQGSGIGKLLSEKEDVISGDHSYMIKDGKIFSTHPDLKVTPGNMVKVALDYKVVARDVSGAIPHVEVRLVGKEDVHPFLKKNVLAPVYNEYSDDPRGRYETNFYMMPFEDDLRLILRCQGRAGIAVDNIEISTAVINTSPTAAPILQSPEEGRELTPAALSLKWSASGEPNATIYDVQFARTSDFENPSTEQHHVGGDWGEIVSPRYYPDHYPEEGTWYWRVRGKNDKGAGPWSGVRSFTIDVDTTTEPPPFRASAKNPLFMLEGEVDTWEQDIPDDLKPYAMLRVRDASLGESDMDELKEMLDEFERKEIPIILFRFPPSEQMEYIYKNYDYVWGVWYGEDGARGNPIDVMYKKFERALKLGEQYGKSVVWSDASWRQMIYVKAITDTAFFRGIQRYKDHLIIQNKLNFPMTPLMDQTTIMGMWLTGMIDQWGAQAEGWFYHPWRDRGTFPPAMYGQNILTNVSGGAVMFSPNIHRGYYAELDTPEEREDVDFPGFGKTWQTIVVPLFREMAHHGLIPDRAQVLQKIEEADVAMMARPQEGDNVGGLIEAINWGSGDFFTFMNGTYGIRHHAELIPNTGRYYFIPVISSLLDPTERTFEHTFTVDDFFSESDVREKINPYFPEREKVQGSAYITNVANKYFVVHTQEYDNQHVSPEEPRNVREETYTLNFNRPYVKQVIGTLNAHQFMALQERPDHIRVHAGNMWRDHSQIQIKASTRPQIRFEDHEEMVTETWDDAAETLTLDIDHWKGSVSFEISEQ